MGEKVELVATDLDGTILRSDKTISQTDKDSLARLGRKKIVRVAATGRSLHKVKEVLQNESLFDYVIFSSGAGIYDCNIQNIIQYEKFNSRTVNALIEQLLSIDLNFFVYYPIPNNNKFLYHRGAGFCKEFNNYMERHKGDYSKLDIEQDVFESGQVMAIILNNDDAFNHLYEQINSTCQNIKIIRATSPVNNQYLWFEIFPKEVSKGHGLKWLCNYLDININKTIGIGNDYNDHDMFTVVSEPYVLQNGVRRIKKMFNTVEYSNNENGFSEVLKVFNL